MKRMPLIMVICMAFLLGVMPIRGKAARMGMPVGGIHILNTTLTGEPLPGAEFEMVREVRDAELEDQSTTKVILKIGEENRIGVKVSFWYDSSMDGEPTGSVTTDAAGKASLYGLPYGTYYLTMVKAPEGYNRITEPIRVTIHKYSHLTQSDDVRDDQGMVIDNTLHIVTLRYNLPDAGRLTFLQMAGSGVVLILTLILLAQLIRFRRESAV